MWLRSDKDTEPSGAGSSCQVFPVQPLPGTISVRYVAGVGVEPIGSDKHPWTSEASVDKETESWRMRTAGAA